MVEAQIPPPIPIPGIKLGLANIVTVYAMLALSPGGHWRFLCAGYFWAAYSPASS